MSPAACLASKWNIDEDRVYAGGVQREIGQNGGQVLAARGPLDIMDDMDGMDNRDECTGAARESVSVNEEGRQKMITLSTAEQDIVDAFARRRPDLSGCMGALRDAHAALVRCYDGGGTLYTCGNGGSNADAMHIVGELCKSFERKRPLAPEVAARLRGLPFGEELAAHLEAGLRAHALGFNGSLKTAVENDSPLRDIAFAQELNALARPGDVLLALSTSGNATNCLMAMSVAKALGATTIALTGPKGGRMASCADVAVRAPGDSTKEVQEAHIALWHTLCCLIEAHHFPEPRG